MNDTQNPHDNASPVMALMGFALGAAVGAGLALLFAPASGRQTRERLASATRRWTADAGHTIDQARETVADLGADAKSAIRAGQDAFQRDRATRGSRSETRMSSADSPTPGVNAAVPNGEEAVR